MGLRDITSGIKWICDYLEIPNYLLLKYKSGVAGEHNYSNEGEYWSDILGPLFKKSSRKSAKLHEGDVVVLKSFQLSPWVSRMPGLFWTHDWEFIEEQAQRYKVNNKCLNLHYEPYGKKMLINGGLGIIRLDKHDKFSIFGATSSGNLDASIPIICTTKVASAINSEFNKYGLLEVDIRGTVQRIPFTFEFHSPNIPRYCVFLDCILNVKKYISDFSLKGNSWVVYRDPNEQGRKACGYCFASINPIDESSIIDSTKWIMDYIDHYTNGEGFPITDFDEIVPRFTNSIVPVKNLMNDAVDYTSLNALFNDIDFRNQLQPVTDWN